MKDLIWVGPHDLTGLSTTVRNFTKAIDLYSDINMKIVEIGSWPTVRKPELLVDAFERMERLKNVPVGTDAVMVQQLNPISIIPSPVGKNVVYTMYETDGYHYIKSKLCNRADEVWVPSEFNMKSLPRGGVTLPMRKLHVPIDTDKFNPDTAGVNEKLKKRIEGKFSFFSAFDFQPRKGYDTLLDAFCRTFDKDEPVVLILKCYRFGEDPELINRILMQIRITLQHVNPTGERPEIIVLPTFLSEEEMIQTMNTVDSYVMPTQGEGWGMPFMESMCLGKPTIGTKWSGQTEFMTPENSFQIRVDTLTPVTNEGMLQQEPFYKGQNMAAVSQIHLQQLMREVYENKEERDKRAKQAREDITTKFSLPVIAAKVEDLLKEM